MQTGGTLAGWGRIWMGRGGVYVCTFVCVCVRMCSRVCVRASMSTVKVFEKTLRLAMMR